MERGQNQSKLLSIWRKIFNLIRSHFAFLSIRKVTLGRPTVRENITTIEVAKNGLLSKVESPTDDSKSVNGVSSQSQIEVEGRPDYGLDNVGPSKIPISNSPHASKENGLLVGLDGAQGPGSTEAQPLPGLNTIIPVESPPNNLKADMKEGNKEKQGQLNGRTFSIDKRSEAFINRKRGNLKEALEDLHVSNGSNQRLPPPPLPPPPPPSLLRYK